MAARQMEMPDEIFRSMICLESEELANSGDGSALKA